MAHTGYQISYSLNLLDSQTYGGSKQWLLQGLVRVLYSAWDVWLQKFSTLPILPALLISSGRESRGGILEKDDRPLGHLLVTAKGWGFPKAFFLNWAEFFNKGFFLKIGFYLLTKSIHKTKEKPHSLLSHARLSWRAAAREILDTLTDISKFPAQVSCLSKGIMSFFWSLTHSQTQMSRISRHRLCLPWEAGENCMAFSYRLGVWGRAVCVPCEVRYLQQSHSSLAASKVSGLDEGCQSRKIAWAGVSSHSHKCYCLSLWHWSALCLCSVAHW